MLAVTKRRDNESGQFQEVYDEDRILDTLGETRLSTKEVAEKLNCHRTTAHRKLRELEEDNKVKSTQVGNTFLWEI